MLILKIENSGVDSKLNCKILPKIDPNKRGTIVLLTLIKHLKSKH